MFGKRPRTISISQTKTMMAGQGSAPLPSAKCGFGVVEFAYERYNAADARLNSFMRKVPFLDCSALSAGAHLTGQPAAPSSLSFFEVTDAV